MVKKTVLGRGLDVLLSNKTAIQSPQQTLLKKLPVEQIQPGRYQPRRYIDQVALAELASSIKAQGLIQPIVVRRLEQGGYELIAGERRWRAAQLIGLNEIPAVIRDIPDQAAAALALIENIQRQDLNVLEEAQALRRLIEEFGLTHQQTADAVGRSRAVITNLLRLMELDESVKGMLERAELSTGHARALLGLRDSTQQLKVAQRVVKLQLNVRATEALVKQLLLDKPPSTPLLVKTVSADIRLLQDSVAERLGVKVSLAHSKRGKGKLIIEYSSLDELEGIIRHIH